MALVPVVSSVLNLLVAMMVVMMCGILHNGMLFRF
jgi:hypothetical protein